jgi:PKD repeat protein
MRKIRILFFLLFITVFAANGYGVTVYISGTITDMQGVGNVPGHKVYIKSDFSSPFHYYKTVYTDNNGYYADTVQNVPAFPIAFQISTYDCNNELHVITVLSTNSPIVADFHICVSPYSGCRAEFTYDSITGLDYKFTDQSQSNSSIISWDWDFGDPASGANNLSAFQNPDHLYSGAGIYNVKLLIHAANGCKDSLVKTVFIQIPLNKVLISGHITNDQTGGPIPDQPVMINTTLIQYSSVVYSNISGFYSDTIANVPNGIPISVATYDCNNILHSNTVFSSSSPVEVDFNICLNTQCRAGFNAILDSGNKVQNSFLFQDLSYGDPNKWSWNFGDGTSSQDRNPIHQYTSQGNYKVSLTITREDSTGAWTCFDTTSKIIKTCSYFNAGGLLFAGLFPINNPHYTGDTGVAYLYRSHNRYTAPVDTVYFTYLGYYTFLNVLEGTYIIKAGLTQGSLHCNKFLPSYNGDQLKWQTTFSFLLDKNIFDNPIHLFAANDSLSGPCMLKGSVVYMGDNLNLPNAEVLLYNDNLLPLRAIHTNSEGFFEFPALPFGTYNLYPEVTGKYARILQVTLDSAHLIAEGLQLEVFDHDVNGISAGQEKNDITIGKIYPNPVTEDFQFWIQSQNTITVHTEILTITGERILLKTASQLQGKILVTLPLRNVPSGMYFLVVKAGDGHILNTQKIIKN